MKYYSCTALEKGIYSIYESKGVGEFLIEGSEKALLIDTGYGNPEFPKVVGSLTKKPLIVMNSHVHGDHSNGNHFFDTVYVGAQDIPVEGEKADFDILIDSALAGFEKKWRIFRRPVSKLLNSMRIIKGKTQYIPFEENAKIDLGGRMIEIVPCPGHTPGSVLVLDSYSRTVFAGDAFNNNTWLFTNPKQKIHEYSQRLKELAKITGYDKIRISHSRKEIDFSFLDFYADFLLRTDLKKSKKINIPGISEPVCIYAEKNTPYGKVCVFYFPSQLIQ